MSKGILNCNIIAQKLQICNLSYERVLHSFDYSMKYHTVKTE